MDAGLAQPFDWASAGEGEAAPAPARARRPGADVAGARPSPAPEPVMSAAEQQAHLAALERDAFAKGYASGERAGVEAGAKRAEGMLRRVAQTLDDLAQLRTRLVHDTEHQMVQLALVVARRVVERELALDPDLVAAMAHVALQRLGEDASATIRLNPEDYTVVAGEGANQWRKAQVQVLPDPAVARGGCLVQSDFGLVDAGLDAQFEELSRALLGTGPRAGANEAPDGR